MESSKEDNNQFVVIQEKIIHLKVFNTFDQAYVVEDKNFDIIIYEGIHIQMNNIFQYKDELDSEIDELWKLMHIFQNLQQREVESELCELFNYK